MFDEAIIREYTGSDSLLAEIREQAERVEALRDAQVRLNCALVAARADHSLSGLASAAGWKRQRVAGLMQAARQRGIAVPDAERIIMPDETIYTFKITGKMADLLNVADLVEVVEIKRNGPGTTVTCRAPKSRWQSLRVVSQNYTSGADAKTAEKFRQITEAAA